MASDAHVVAEGVCRCGQPIETSKPGKGGKRIFNYECNACRERAVAALRPAEPEPMTLTEFVAALPEAEQAAIEERAAELMAEETAAQKPPLHSGLKRDLRFQERMRSALDKFEAGATLNQKEYRLLLLFYGVQVTISDIVGIRYDLLGREATAAHRRLVDMADAQGFTQGLLSMYGVVVNDLFERFC